MLLGQNNCNRIQMVLTDGDDKMYGAFDQVKDKFYPNAIHALCLFHLIVQKLGEMHLQMYKEDPSVEAMANTFKLWLFSWMVLGGVEDEKEFQYSLGRLHSWLAHWRTKEQAHHNSNATRLEEFLTKSILPHKERWFFPGRRGKLTLDLKTTSPLESINHALKHTSGCKVQPNMTLLKSLQMQDVQASLRNRERQVQACERARGRSTSIRSHTVNFVSPIAESVIQAQGSQANRYACRVSIGNEELLCVQLKRRPEEPEFCEACEEKNEYCSAHAATSPIPVFRRVRVVKFLPTPCRTWYQVICDCFTYGCLGCPCRHVRVLLKVVHPHHVAAKHHTKFQPWYGKKGKQHITEEFNRRRNDYRLMVTTAEKHDMIRVAIGLSAQSDAEFGVDFWLDVGPKANSLTGLVSPSKVTVGRSVDHLLDVDCESGFMSQELSLTQEALASDHQDDATREESIEDAILHTENLHDLLKSATTIISDRNRLLANPRVEAGIREKIGDLLAWLNEETIKLHATERSFTGDVVSCNVSIDKRKQAIRLKRKSEYIAKNARASVQKKALLNAGSVL